MDKLISIIVVAYNVGDKLKQCIESILNQTYSNIELVIVNDGSTDLVTADISRHYESIDNRIKFIDKDNEGVAEARNVGVSNATGAYIMFVDADDYIAEDCVQYLYGLINEYDCQISCCGSWIVEGEQLHEKSYRKNREAVIKLNSDEALVEMLYERLFSNSIWGKMYQSKLFDGISFPYGKRFEDMFVVPKLIIQSNGVVSGKEMKHYYRKTNSGIMENTISHNRMDIIEAELSLIEAVSDKDVLKAAYAKLFASSIVAFSKLKNADKNSEEFVDQKLLWQNIVKNRVNILFNNNVLFKYRLLAAVSFMGKDFLTVFYNRVVK